jgi:UDP-glucose 4-epimerase
VIALRALVTGGAGFIGSHVADLLVGQGHSVTVVDDLSTGRRENVPEAATFVLLDITSPDIAPLVRDGKFDVILHHAAQMDVRKSVADPVSDGTVNILGTVRLMEAVRKARTHPRIVFASTGGVLYGDFVTPPNEETFAKDPESPYAIAKLTSEYYLAYYARVHGIDAVALRYGNVYGPRQNPHGEAGVVAIFCGRILDRLPLTVFGDGRQTRDYVFVSDVARAAQMAASAILPPIGRLDARAFNVGTGVGTSVLDLAEALCRISGIRLPIEYAPARLGEQQRSFVSIHKAAAQLGWRPTVGLEDGLATTYRWFAEQHAPRAASADHLTHTV